MTAVGVTEMTFYLCEPYGLPLPTDVCLARGSVVRGRVTSAGASDAGRGVPGLSVSVTTNLFATWTGSTDADGWFEIGVDSGTTFVFFHTGPVTWTASTDGDATHMGSSTAGVYAPVPHAE